MLAAPCRCRIHVESSLENRRQELARYIQKQLVSTHKQGDLAKCNPLEKQHAC
jgi:hypothetical protein